MEGEVWKRDGRGWKGKEGVTDIGEKEGKRMRICGKGKCEGKGK